MKVVAAGMAWNVETAGDPDAPALLLLHGFAGSQRTWAAAAAYLASARFLIMPDLPGHGATPVHAELTLPQLADALVELCGALTESPLSVGGYSMGGRIALHMMSQHAAKISGAVLLGASPGIADTKRRAERRRSDDELAARIEASPIDWFVDFWERQPIFASQRNLAPDRQAAIRAERLKCSRAGLVAALRNWGTGVQDYLPPRLSAIEVPTLLLAGELDEKFRASNEILRTALPAAHARVIPGAGHAAHLEQPAAFAEAVRGFLSSTEDSHS
jgi:2-succinyl-6-hydroxy-2,4-cyclohexadiene-1-carboxylate synthase